MDVQMLFLAPATPAKESAQMPLPQDARSGEFVKVLKEIVSQLRQQKQTERTEHAPDVQKKLESVFKDLGISVPEIDAVKDGENPEKLESALEELVKVLVALYQALQNFSVSADADLSARAAEGMELIEEASELVFNSMPAEMVKPEKLQSMVSAVLKESKQPVVVSEEKPESEFQLKPDLQVAVKQDMPVQQEEIPEPVVRQVLEQTNPEKPVQVQITVTPVPVQTPVATKVSSVQVEIKQVEPAHPAPVQVIEVKNVVLKPVPEAPQEKPVDVPALAQPVQSVPAESEQTQQVEELMVVVKQLENLLKEMSGKAEMAAPDSKTAQAEPSPAVPVKAHILQLFSRLKEAVHTFVKVLDMPAQQATDPVEIPALQTGKFLTSNLPNLPNFQPVTVSESSALGNLLSEPGKSVMSQTLSGKPVSDAGAERDIQMLLKPEQARMDILSELKAPVETGDVMLSAVTDNSLPPEMLNALDGGAVQFSAPSSHAAESAALRSAPSPASLAKTVLDQVVPEVVRSARIAVSAEGISEARIRLKPEHLGDIRMKVVMEEKIITAQFQVQSQSVREIIESQFQNLKEQLSQQGLKVDKFTVSVSQQFTPQQGEKFQQPVFQENVQSVPVPEFYAGETEQMVSASRYAGARSAVDYLA